MIFQWKNRFSKTRFPHRTHAINLLHTQHSPSPLAFPNPLKQKTHRICNLIEIFSEEYITGWNTPKKTTPQSINRILSAFYALFFFSIHWCSYSGFPRRSPFLKIKPKSSLADCLVGPGKLGQSVWWEIARENRKFHLSWEMCVGWFKRGTGTKKCNEAFF